MYLPSTIRTSFGPRRLPAPALVRVSLTVRELHELARLIEREATDAERHGRYDVSHMLYARATALREAAR